MFAQRWSCLTTNFSERIPIVKRRRLYMNFVFFAPCIVNTIIQYKPIQLYNINQRNAHFLNQYFNFEFLCLLRDLNPRVHLQEDGCIYSNGMVHFTCIGISCLAGRNIEHTILPTRPLIAMHVKRTIPLLYTHPCSWRWTLRSKACRRYQKLIIKVFSTLHNMHCRHGY
jgi:hypothetical protein